MRTLCKNKLENTQLTRVAAFLICIIACGFLVVIGRPFLAPLIGAGMLAAVLHPVVIKLESFRLSTVWAVSLTFVALFCAIILVFGLFGTGLGLLLEDVQAVKQNLPDKVAEAFSGLAQNLGLPGGTGKGVIQDNINSITQKVAEGVGGALIIGSNAIVGIASTMLYTFFILLYRSGIKDFLMSQVPETKRESSMHMLKNMRQQVQSYFGGLLIVIGILAVLNSFGLMVIGLENAIYWGCLAATLAVIPYIGTFIGAAIPTLFSLFFGESSSEPLFIMGWFLVVQTLEGNVITPNIVGNQVKVNPFIAILAMVLGGTLWGVIGLIFAIPIVAMFKIFCLHHDRLKALGRFLGNGIKHDDPFFTDKFNKPKFRLGNVFSYKNAKRSKPSEGTSRE